MPHSDVAADEGADGPTGDLDAFVGGPAATALLLGVGDGFGALHVDDGEVGVVTQRDSALAAQAEYAVRAMAGEIDKTGEREAALIGIDSRTGKDLKVYFP